MIRFRTLGGIDLRDAQNRELRTVLAQPKRLALLAYLALARPDGPRRRDTIVGLFWPELDDSRARAALNSAVHFLRQSLGSETIVSRSAEELAIDGEGFWCDAAAFDLAISGGDAETALELFRGDFLPGLFLENAQPFDEWLEHERARTRALAARAAHSLAEHREHDGMVTSAVNYARQAAKLSGMDERAVRQLLQLLERLGDRAGALHAYESFAALLANEYVAEPAAETKAIIERVRSRVGPVGKGGDVPAFFQLPVDPNEEVAAFRSRLQATLGNRYTLEHQLDAGHMSRVFVATEAALGRKVVLKVLSPASGEGVSVERFKREIQLAAQLAHPHIVPVLSAGDAGGLPFYTMPLVEGESLRQRLKDHVPIPIVEALVIMRDVASALAAAHDVGIVHRDIKPANVLLTRGSAIVTDFGVAKAIAAARDADPSETITRPGRSPGTPVYMAPEQAAGDPDADHRVDVYAFGVMAYEMLAGRPPFHGLAPQDLLAAHMTVVPQPVQELRPDTPPQLARLVMQCLEKAREARPGNGARLVELLASATFNVARLESADGASDVGDSRSATTAGATPLRWAGRSRRAQYAGVALGIVVLVATLAWTANRGRDARWVRETAIPTMQLLITEQRIEEAHDLARRAATILPGDSALNAAWSLFSPSYLPLSTSPAGATVYRAPMNDTTDWEVLGTTSADSARIPAERLGVVPSLFRIEKPGFRTRYVPLDAMRREPVLDSAVETDSEMVRVSGGGVLPPMWALGDLRAVALTDFLMDRFEVTNLQFQAFVDAGGYSRAELWEPAFFLRGRRVPRNEAMTLFVDRTGRTGPATWEGGHFPPDQQHMPVSGVSWYEASAYAKWIGKSLPTVFHWHHAARVSASMVQGSNMESEGPVAASSPRGMSPFGLFHMAGNVREWCENASGSQRFILGGGWPDQPYILMDAFTKDPFDRSVANGIRLMKYLHDEPRNIALVTRPLERQTRDFLNEVPVSDAEFSDILKLYDYDRTPFNEKRELQDSTEEWVREKVSFDAAYGDDRVFAYLYLPRHAPKPYQAVMFFPGSGAFVIKPPSLANFTAVDFVVRSGRAVVYPIYQSTHERKNGWDDGTSRESIRYRDQMVMWVKDFRRSVDYLATRGDIDMDRLAYFGVSWGGNMGGIIPAIEPRLRASILYVAGLPVARARPEVDPLSFLPRVRLPVLMLSGKLDPYYPLETSQRPFMELLGTPPQHKRHFIAEGGHYVPRPDLIRESLSWLDRYLGRVK